MSEATTTESSAEHAISSSLQRIRAQARASAISSSSWMLLSLSFRSDPPIASLGTLGWGGRHLDSHSDASAADDAWNVADDGIDDPVTRLQSFRPDDPLVVRIRSTVTDRCN